VPSRSPGPPTLALIGALAGHVGLAAALALPAVLVAATALGARIVAPAVPDDRR
jgi:hypothetical protein